MRESSSINNIAASISYNTLSPRGHNIEEERERRRQHTKILLVRLIGVGVHTIDLDDGRTLRKVSRDDDLHEA